MAIGKQRNAFLNNGMELSTQFHDMMIDGEEWGKHEHELRNGFKYLVRLGIANVYTIRMTCSQDLLGTDDTLLPSGKR